MHHPYRICHDNNSVVITILNFKVSTNTSTNSMNNRINFFILKISSKRAFSVLITFPRRGKITGIYGRVPILQNLPLKHPQLDITRFISIFYFAQGVNLPDNNVSLRLFSFRACIFSALRAASRALSFNCF